MPDFNQSMQGAASTMRRSEKDWMTTLLLCLFCGGIGVHRYYVGKDRYGDSLYADPQPVRHRISC